MAEQKQYGTVKITDSRSIVIQESIVKDSIDLRTYVYSEKYTGYTKKGFVLPNDKISELIGILKKVLEEKASG